MCYCLRYENNEGCALVAYSSLFEDYSGFYSSCRYLLLNNIRTICVPTVAKTTFWYDPAHKSLIVPVLGEVIHLSSAGSSASRLFNSCHRQPCQTCSIVHLRRGLSVGQWKKISTDTKSRTQVQQFLFFFIEGVASSRFNTTRIAFVRCEDPESLVHL